MPSHWETSGRPLFVKTVFVNGNRHAILFDEDPLLRCGDPLCKKISRSSSSSSFATDFSLSCSESLDSSSEGRGYKPKALAQRSQKEKPSELQSCLIGLKLGSGDADGKCKSKSEHCSCGSKEPKRSQSKEKGNFKQKRHKWNYEKVCRRKQREQFYGETNDFKSAGRKNGQASDCYVYNLENYKGKKKYCFVKISSQSPQFILNCCCEKSPNEAHNPNPPGKNNLVISATIHNLVMAPEGNENLLHKTFDYFFPFHNPELHWNNYLTKSYCNSLSDRVFQWLDLARKQKKQKEKSNLSEEETVSNTSTDRIFSGKTFVGQNTECNCGQESKTIYKKVDEVAPNWEQVKREVAVEPNQSPTNKSNSQVKNSTIKPPEEAFSTRPGSSILTYPSVPPLKIQDLLFNCHSKSCCTPRERNKKKTKEIRSAIHRNKQIGTDNNEEGEDHIITTANTWEKEINRKSVSVVKSDSHNKQSQSHYNRYLDEQGDKIKNPNSGEESSERNQKSINNPNITRTRPVFIQNLLSPQQSDKMCYLQEENIVWASEKNTGRPQLHIFMPSVLRKDQSDDSMSECDNFLTL